MGEVVAWLEAILRGQGPIDLHLGCSTFVVSRSLDVDRILKRERIAVLLVGPARSVVTIHWSVSHCGVLISITIYIYINIHTYYDVDEKQCVFPSPYELMFLLTSSLLSKKNMVSSNPRVGSDQGPDIMATKILERLLLLDAYLEDEANSFHELREVQVLHILARERGADGTLDAKTHLHPTRYSIAPKKLPSEMKWLSKKTWNLKRSRTFCLQQVLCWRDIVLHNSDSYFAQSACIIIHLFSFWVTLASFFPS